MADYIGYGTTLEWDPAGGTTYATIGQIYDITPPNPTRTSVDVTDHSSTSRWMEYIKGLKDGGEVSFGVIYDPVLATHDASTGLLSDFSEDSVIPAWRITFPDTGTTSWTFKGLLTGASPATPINDKMTMAVTVKISGVLTLA